MAEIRAEPPPGQDGPDRVAPRAGGRRRRRRALLAGVAATLVAGALGVGVAGLRLTARWQEPYRGYAGAEVFVEIPPGEGALEIADRLVRAGVLRDRWAFRYALWRRGGGRRLQAGEYRFDRAMRPGEVLEALVRGAVHLRTVTFPEGLTIDEMAEVFGRTDFGAAEDFRAASRDTSLVAALDPDTSTLEGYLFPDTYALPRTATADDLVRAMVARFEEAFDEALRVEVVAAGLTVREVVALASLIEKETGKPEERPIVGAVYRNRLERGMPLQCDPTVIYALTLDGLYDGNLTRESLAYDSPYNTYRYPGLPPGPIASPGRAALEAALRPADVDYLYFVSRNDGSHAFARSLAEHNRNVREYQILRRR